MSGNVNVNRSVTDPFYRYKMPKIIAKVEGKGNGIKTVIPNMADIAKSLGRPPTYPTKYFGCELGAQVQFDHKNERYIVNGSHEPGKLQNLLDGFIKKFVLCPSCDNPETVYNIQPKKGIVTSRCKACGNSYTLDLSHRLTTFILKNPPDAPLGTSGASLSNKGKGKKAKGVVKNGSSPNKKNEDGEDGEDGQAEDENDELGEDGQAEDEDNDEDWGEEATDEAVRQRMSDLTEGVKNLATCDDLELSEKERVDKLFDYIKQKKEEGLLGKPGVDKELVAEGDRLDIKDRVAFVLSELLLTENIQKELKQYHKLFLRATFQKPKAQRYLLRGVEIVIANHKATLVAKVSHVLKILYDLDLVEEQAFLEWAKKSSKRTNVPKELALEIREKAAPFMTWLEEAEEEDSDAEESDVEIEYDERARVSELKEKPEASPPAKASVVKNDEQDDIDIDDI